MNQKLYIKLIKKELIDTLEAGTITEAVAQWALVESYLSRFVMIGNEKVDKIINTYFEDQMAIKEKIKEFKNKIEENKKEIQKLTDEYGKNIESIYEEIKKL